MIIRKAAHPQMIRWKEYVISNPHPHLFLSRPPAAGWNLVRSRAGNGTWEVQSVSDLNEAAGLLTDGDDIVLGLPVNAVLAQRLRLPTVDPTEFGGMVRIQVEKTLPYPPEEVTSDFELIEQGENESVISSIAVHNAKLAELAAPLLKRGFIPRQVTVYAAQRAASHAASGRALFIYPRRRKARLRDQRERQDQLHPHPRWQRSRSNCSAICRSWP